MHIGVGQQGSGCPVNSVTRGDLVLYRGGEVIPNERWHFPTRMLCVFKFTRATRHTKGRPVHSNAHNACRRPWG